MRDPIPRPAGRTRESPSKTITRHSGSGGLRAKTIVQDTTKKKAQTRSGVRLESPPSDEPARDEQPSRRQEGERQLSGKRFTQQVRSSKSSDERPLGPNRLLDEASSLLALGGSLLGSEKPNDLEQLRADISDAVSRYLENIQDYYRSGTVRSAGFCLCAFIDDCVLRTLWGQESPWRESSMLATVYGTAQRHNLASQIEKDIQEGADSDLFALYHTVFSLGYVGMSDEHEVVRLREDVYHQIKSAGHKDNLPLVSASMIRAQEGEPLARRLPWWTVLAGAMALSLLVYWVFWSLLQPAVENFHETLLDDTTFKHVQLGPQDFFPETQPVPDIQVQVDLRQLLVEQGVSEDVFALVAADPGTRIVLLADGMFSSGSTNLNTRFLPVLQSIGLALARTSGPIIVEGHTDDVPFASGLRTNRTLSEDRSNVVGNVLARQLGGRERLTAKGRADQFPILCNSNSDNRRRNRRVELILPDIETYSAERRPRPVCDQAS